MGRLCVWVSLLTPVLVGMSFGSADSQAADSTQSPAISERVLTETVEITTARDANSRTWENVYHVPVLDADGNLPGETEEVRSSLIEVGDGLNYDARPWAEIADGGAANWQRTVTDWVRTGDESRPLAVTPGPLQVTLSDDLTRWDHVRVQGDAETLILGVAGLVIQDTATGDFLILEQPQRVRPVVEGNRVLYPGAFSCSDIEYVYTPGGFKQNLIIHDLSEIPAPESLGFDPATTVLGLASTMDLRGYSHTLSRVTADADPMGVSAALSRDDVVQLADTENLTFINSAGGRVLEFARSTAWDATAAQLIDAPVREALSRQSDVDLLIDAVDMAWLSEAELPVTVDYTITLSGGQGPKNLLFERGITYFISSPFTVGNCETLVIEPGAIVKVNGGVANPYRSYIQVSDRGQVQVLGQPFDPVLITSADSSVGDDVSGISGYRAGQARRAFEFSSGADSTEARASRIEHCRFSNFQGAISIAYGVNFDAQNIRHCVFRDVTVPLNVWSLSNQSSTLEVTNCAFLNTPNSGDAQWPAWNPAILVYMRDQVEMNIIGDHLTSHNHRILVQVSQWSSYSGDGSSAVLELTNSLVSNAEYMIADYTSQAVDIDVEGVLHNRIVRRTTAPLMDNFGGSYDTSNTLDTGDPPFVSGNPAGEFYAGGISGGSYTASGIKDAGTSTANPLVSGMTIAAPAIQTGSLSGTVTWFARVSGASNVIVDTGNSDIGYHHQRVDHVVDGAMSVTGSLTIDEGTRVAMNDGASLTASSGGSVAIKGDTESGAFVEFFSTGASGDQADAPGPGDHSGIAWTSSAASQISVCGLRMRHATSGLSVYRSGCDASILDSEFLDCGTGISMGDSFDTVTRNCLFSRCDDGVWMEFGYSETLDLVIDVSTFFACERGLNFAGGDEFATLALTLRNNLWTNCGAAIWADQDVAEFYSVTITESNNTWYANADAIVDDSQDQFILLETGPSDDRIQPDDTIRGNLRENPRLSHHSGAERAQAGGDFSDVRWRSSLFSHDDGFFLSQEEDDVSRWPFVVPDGVGVAAITLDSYTGIEYLSVAVGIAPESSIPAAIVGTANNARRIRVEQATVSENVAGNQTGPGRLWLAYGDFEGYDEWSLGSNTDITIAFDNGDSVIVPAPVTIGDGDTAIPLWTAADGSAYWGHSSQAAQDTSSLPIHDQCSGYALAVDPGGLASAVGPTSPLINAGERFTLIGGSTSTDKNSDVLFPDIGYHTTGGVEEADPPPAPSDGGGVAYPPGWWPAWWHALPGGGVALWANGSLYGVPDDSPCSPTGGGYGGTPPRNSNGNSSSSHAGTPLDVLGRSPQLVVTDFELPANSPVPLTISRTYHNGGLHNGHWDGEGILGLTWHLNWEECLVQPGNRYVNADDETVDIPTGQGIWFGSEYTDENGDTVSTYASIEVELGDIIVHIGPQGEQTQYYHSTSETDPRGDVWRPLTTTSLGQGLLIVGDDSYTLEGPDGIEKTFNSHGHLTQVSDPQGRVLLLDWDTVNHTLYYYPAFKYNTVLSLWEEDLPDDRILAKWNGVGSLSVPFRAAVGGRVGDPIVINVQKQVLESIRVSGEARWLEFDYSYDTGTDVGILNMDEPELSTLVAKHSPISGGGGYYRAGANSEALLRRLY